MLAERLGQLAKIVLGAQLRVQLAMVDDVVAVRASFGSPEKWREIRGADPQRQQIIDQLAQSAKRKCRPNCSRYVARGTQDTCRFPVIHLLRPPNKPRTAQYSGSSPARRT